MRRSRAAATKRRTVDEIAGLMAEFKDSGMSVAEFARQIGVSVPTVYQWRRRIGGNGGFRGAAEPVPPSMVRVISSDRAVLPFVGRPPGNAAISLVLSRGVLCRVEPDFDEQTLLRLVTLLAPIGE